MPGVPFGYTPTKGEPLRDVVPGLPHIEAAGAEAEPRSRSTKQTTPHLAARGCRSICASPSPTLEGGRRYVGEQLEAIRRLRNRIAHHENLLDLPIVARLNGSLALLGMINEDFPDLVMGRNALRRLAAEDPRRHWGGA